jgi:protein-S-isoprenylcysteine O-methyltransferase Ste14
MDFLPPVRFGILNGWLLLVAYFVGLTVSALAFPPDKRKKLFLEPHYPRGHPRWIILTIGRIAAISFVALTVPAPLRPGTDLFTLGLGIYVVGYAVVMISLSDYRRPPADRLATEGLYRYSRNPQWVGLVGVFVGAALAVAGWLQLALVLVVVFSYHFQILLEEKICESTYGEAYRTYANRVPRYLFR